MSEPGATAKRIRKKPSGILKLDNVRRRESSGSSLLHLGDELSPPSSVSPQLSVTWAFPPVGQSRPDLSDADNADEGDALNSEQHPAVGVHRGTFSAPASDGGTSGPPEAGGGNPSATTAYPNDPAQRPVKALPVNGSGNVMKSSDITGASSFFGGDQTGARCETDDDEDYSASLNAIIQRKASVKKKRAGYKGHRRASSPISQMMGLPDGGGDGRRRSSVYTTSSGETGITLPGDEHSLTGGRDESSGRQDKLFDTIRLHKEVLQTVKLQPISMKRKLKLVQQAKSYIERHEGALQEHFTSRTARSLMAQFNIFLTTKWQQLLRELANLVTYLIPWESRIKEIESHFGSVVASYFTFLRWLFWVNVVISVLLVVFIMVPEEIYVDPEKAKCDIRKSMSHQERALTRNFSTIWEFEGHLKYSPLFYGMAENSRMSKLSSKDDEYVFSWKLFTGWDYMIGHMETAQNRMASIILGFKEALLEEAEKNKDTRNWKIILLRILVNLLILGLLVISAYEVILVVKRSMDINESDSWWRRNEITVVMSLISFFFPMIFEALGIMEYYHPRKQLRIQLARIMVLNMLNLYSLIFALFDKIAHMTTELRKMKPINFTSSASQCFVPQEGSRWNVSSLLSDGSFAAELLANLTLSGYGPGTVMPNGSSCFRVPTNCASTSETGAGVTTTLLTTLLLTSLSPTAIPDFSNASNALSTIDFSTSFTTTTPSTTEYHSPYDEFDYSDYEGYLKHRARLLPNDNLEGVPINKREAIFVTNSNEMEVTDASASATVQSDLTTSIPRSTEQSAEFSTEFQTMTYTEVYKFVTGRFDEFLESYYYSEESDDAREVTDSQEEELEYEANQFLTSEETLGLKPSTTERTRGLEQSTTEGQTRILTTTPTTTGLVTDSAMWTRTETEEQLLLNSTTEPSTPSFEELTTEGERKQNDLLPTATAGTVEPEVPLRTEDAIQSYETSTTTTENPNICYRLLCTPSSTQTMDGQDSKYRNADIRSLCWETMFGQELAKLTVMDLYGDFKIAENILHLVNNQGMVWMGMFFSPGLAVLNIAKLVIILYLRSWTVLTCNVPHEVVFRASRSNNFYFALLLTMLFLCVLPVSYAIVFLEPSWHCGPFSNSNRIYHLLTNATERIVPEMVTKYIVSPAAVIPLLVLLILIIYYLLSLTGSLREANQDLKLQLRKERTEERRKMFKIATSTQQQTPGTGINGLSSSWHKVLDSTQMRLQSTTDNATDSENSTTKRKELLQRMMKKALHKENTHTAEGQSSAGQMLSAAPPVLVSPPVLGTVNEKRRPVTGKPGGRSHDSDVFRFDRHAVEQMGGNAADDNDGRKKFERTRPSTAERFRMAAQAERRRIQNLRMAGKATGQTTADWIEQIPVITISKTSSDECIIESDLDDPNDRKLVAIT
uniref:Uncharacterized protein n=1 Tax=Anopheles atroparvus TaxID=41427 RepID=A0A182ITU4_ANOAO